MDSNWPHRTQQFVEGITASVAIVGRGGSGDFVVTACNDSFVTMSGVRRENVRRCPVSLDALIPSYARHELRKKLQECFDTGRPRELEQAYDLKDGTHWWRLSLNPFRHSGGEDPVVEIIVTGLDITPKMILTR